MKFAEHFECMLINEGNEPDIIVATQQFSQITEKIVLRRYPDIHSPPKVNAILFYLLVREFLAPISIVLGDKGYKTENGLRTAFVDIPEKRNGNNSLGIPSIPTLATSNQFCHIKGNEIHFSIIISCRTNE